MWKPFFEMFFLMVFAKNGSWMYSAALFVHYWLIDLINMRYFRNTVLRYCISDTIPYGKTIQKCYNMTSLIFFIQNVVRDVFAYFILLCFIYYFLLSKIVAHFHTFLTVHWCDSDFDFDSNFRWKAFEQKIWGACLFVVLLGPTRYGWLSFRS